MLISSDYPNGAIPVTNSATGTTAAITATLPTGPGKTTYLAGLQVTSSGATAGGASTITVTGTINGSLNYVYTQPTLTASDSIPLVVQFMPAIPASAVNTTIAASVTLGAGTTAGAVTLVGYQI